MDVGVLKPAASMRILVVNAGSSSLKLRVLDPGDELVGSWDPPADAGPGTLRGPLGGVHGIQAVGHRIVHGGTELTEPVRIDRAVEARLRALTELAPLHQPKSLKALDAVTALLPDLPAVACFDTAFHASMPAAAATYALPRAWRERWPLRRFGFHGLSHAYAARRAAELVGRPGDDLRIVSCHLGAGASVTAVRQGRSVDTTMGFTPLEGIVMATRSGSVDPGLVLWLQQRQGLPAAELGDALEHRSGLKGLAGSADMSTILEAMAAGDADATLAVEVYLHRLCGAIAAMAAAAGGIDVLSFTGGVGENAPAIRRLACERLAWLGVAIDDATNTDGTGDRDLSSDGAAVRTLVIAAREDIEIARQVRGVLA